MLSTPRRTVWAATSTCFTGGSTGPPEACTAYFALPEEDCAAGAASAGASLARTDYARALAKLSREKAAFPDMSHETLNSAFPGRSQGMIQVLSTADGQLNRLNQSGLK